MPKENSIQEAYSKSTIQIINEYLISHNHDVEEFSELIDTLSDQDCGEEYIDNEVSRIWELAINRFDDNNLGLRAGTLISNGIKSHLLVTIAANSANAMQALENFCEYHELCSDSPHPRMVKRPDSVAIEISFVESIDNEVIRHMSECMFSGIVTTLRVLCKKNFSPKEVHFSWPKPPNFSEHIELFNCKVNFSSHINALVFDKEIMKTGIPYSDKILLDVLRGHAQNQLQKIKQNKSWVERVYEVLNNSKNDKNYDITTTSSILCVSPRTLQDRLKNEGSSYQDILKNVKTRIAKERLLNKNNSISDIASLLGYSEQSAFNHAFKRWTGMTPKKFRNKHHAELE